MNSWEAILRGVKPENLLLRASNFHHSPLKVEKNAGGLVRKLQLSYKVPREQSFRGWTVGG